ncbi:hypothetical protein ADUPG1_014534, partial [Aduncisulcus paluster]
MLSHRLIGIDKDEDAELDE